jgi:Fe-S cluster assembly iron-binding protein IscA
LDNKVKIKISEKAYDKIMELLNIHKEYDCVRFSYSPGCCKSPKVSILLDNADNIDIIDKIENITLIYDDNLINNIREIQLIYKNNSFAVKALPRNNEFSCNNKNHNDDSSCDRVCSKCSKKCN